MKDYNKNHMSVNETVAKYCTSLSGSFTNSFMLGIT
jgi:hypothetical protein